MTAVQTYPAVWHHTGCQSEKLTENLTCDAAIVGGGLTGVSLAYLLGERGFSTVLLEQNTIASGKTGHSTAKATVAHNCIYSSLAEHVSPEASRKYAAANLAGLAFLRDQLQRMGMLAESRRDFYLYALHGENRLLREYHAMHDNGIVCDYLGGNAVPLPFEVKAAIRLHDQLLLDPAAFTSALAGAGKFRYYENTRAEMLSGHVLRCGGHTVTAEHVIFASGYPVHIPGFFAPFKLSGKTSYAAAFRSENGFSFPQVMAYGIDGGYGYRYAPDRSLIVSGEAHRGAPAPNTAERVLDAVRAFAPDAEPAEEWTNNDTYTHDGIPYVGKTGGVYVACGYSAWGMTNAAAAAVLLAEQIAGGSLWYEDIFSPDRNFLHGGKREFSEHISTAAGGMMKHYSSLPDRKAEDLAPGEGGIVAHESEKVGGYRDENGTLHFVTLRCPHLGCSLEWNETAKTWDCPCHGSRFSAVGECLSGPAERGIALK